MSEIIQINVEADVIVWYARVSTINGIVGWLSGRYGIHRAVRVNNAGQVSATWFTATPCINCSKFCTHTHTNAIVMSKVNCDSIIITYGQIERNIYRITKKNPQKGLHTKKRVHWLHFNLQYYFTQTDTPFKHVYYSLNKNQKKIKTTVLPWDIIK